MATPSLPATPNPALNPASNPVIVHWVSSDGLFGVITARDWPQGCGRSRTRDTIIDAANATWEAGLVTPVGPGSRNKYIKVRLVDLGVPVAAQPSTGGKGSLGTSALDKLRPGNYAQPGRKFIPEYPHTCPTCGGKMLQLFTSQEHEGGGQCPGAPSKMKGRR